jgi:predicted hotdog family 3-hydroxylacyl-ACP dehydratase
MTRYPPVEDLVPHAPPALALDELVDYHDGIAKSRLVVRDGALLVHDGGVDTVVAIEWMAQTVAACLGYEAFLGGVGVRVGMVVACRQFTIGRAWIGVGECIGVTARRVRGTDDISSFAGEVHDARGELVASALMTLVHSEKPPD